MEFKEFIQIFKNNFKLFILVIILIIAGGFIYFSFLPISYGTSLTLNITRSGSQNTDNYKFDDFYRLQADEKFAETLVEWLKSPRIVADIYDKAGVDYNGFSLRKFSKVIKPEKMSSQVVAVSYSSPNSDIAKKISAAIISIVSKNIANLNTDQKENTWFKIDASDPLIVLNKVTPLEILMIFFLIGIFIAFWIVLITHYLK